MTSLMFFYILLFGFQFLPVSDQGDCVLEVLHERIESQGWDEGRMSGGKLSSIIDFLCMEKMVSIIDFIEYFHLYGTSDHDQGNSVK